MKKVTAKVLALPFSLLLALIAYGGGRPSGEPRDGDLLGEITALDAAVFDAYNHCELEKFGSFFTEELEFYHDNGGLTAQSRASLVEAVKNNICGKTQRQLVAGTLEVYPLHGYGAVELGVHRFHPPGKPDQPTGEAKFIHLWRNQDGAWKITRVISYDHHPLAQ